MPFTLRNLKADLEDVGSNFDGAPDLEFRMATQALALEQSGLSYQSVPPEKRTVAGARRGGHRSPGELVQLVLTPDGSVARVLDT